MTNPEEYLENILKAAKKNHHELKVYKGEARSATLGRIHAGITSTRIDIKMRCVIMKQSWQKL